MRTWPVRFTIGRLMVVIAAVAGVCAVSRIPGVMIILAIASSFFWPTLLAFAWPFFFANQGARVYYACWIWSLWPLLALGSLHVLWLIACGALGHTPGPTDHSNLIDVLTLSASGWMVPQIISWLFCLLFCDQAHQASRKAGSQKHLRTFLPGLLMPACYLSAFLISQWDPLGVVTWYTEIAWSMD